MQLNPPEAFFNVVNSIAIPAAPSYPLHRLGGAYFSDHLFLSTPRSAKDGGVYLDLQINYFGPQPGHPDVLILPSGFTWGLDGNVVQGRILSRIEAFNANAATVIWVETCFFSGDGPVQKAIFKYAVPRFGNNSALHPGEFGPVGNELADIHAFTFEGQPAKVLDFTTASASGTIYLFWTELGQHAISWAAFDGTRAVSCGPLVILDSDIIFSIDATAVQMKDRVTGEQKTRIAVMALTPAGGGDVIPHLNGWLFETDGRLVEVLALPPLPNPNPAKTDAFSSTIRATWGTLAAGSSAPSNGIVLAYVPSRGDEDYDEAKRAFSPFFNGLGPLLVSEVDLTGNLVAEWTRMDPRPLPAWGDQFSAASAPLSVLFPIPLLDADHQTFRVLVGHAAAAKSRTLFELDRFFLNVLSSFKLTITDPGRPQSSNIQRSFNREDIVAAIGSWTLIGVISGLPPYVQEQPPGTVVVKYALDTVHSVSDQLATSKTVTVGGTVGPIKGSFAHSVIDANKATTNTAQKISLTWSNGDTGLHALAADEGVAIFWHPDYQSATYSIANAAGQFTGLTLALLWASGPGTIGFRRFRLTNLNEPADESLFAQVFAAAFPSLGNHSQFAWPRSDDPERWMSNTPPLAEPLPLLRQPQALQIGGALVDESLQFGTTKGTTTTTTNKVTVNVAPGAFGFMKLFGINFGGELSFASTVETTLGQSQTFSITYDGLARNSRFRSFGLRPRLLQPAADGAPWMPSYNAGQRPWLLTWIIEAAIPRPD